MSKKKIKLNFIDDPIVREWILQFDKKDQLLATFLLRSMILVSSASLDKGLTLSIDKIPVMDKERVALIPIRKPKVSKCLGVVKRPTYTSAELIGNLLRNKERLDGKKYVVDPTIHSMIKEKIKHIVLVDDVIGSGQRVCGYWKRSLPKKIKSWLSLKYCKIWIVSYAGHRSGIGNIIKTIKNVNRNMIKTYVDLAAKNPIWTDQVYTLCEKYGQKTYRPMFATGYRKAMSPLVFEHGCPNNVPSILWAKGKHWKPLFPNRAIPNKLKIYFTDYNTASISSDLLALSNQYTLALKLLDEDEAQEFYNDNIKIFTILGLLLRGNKYLNLPELLMSNKDEVEELIIKAENYGLVSPTKQVTMFGKDLIKRLRKEKSAKKKEYSYDKKITYIPKQFSLKVAKP